MTALRTRRLGRTELAVSEVGLGAMDTPHSPEGSATVARALELGVTFIDMAREYEGSEYLVGQALRDHGPSSVHIASKTFSHSVHGSQRDIDRSLSFLGVERIDLYQLHDISTEAAWEEALGEDGALEGLQVAQYRGLIGHIGVSSHELGLVERAIRSGVFDTVMLEYSAFAPEAAPVIDLAMEHDVGVIVMRPLGGSGRTSVMRGHMADGYDGPLTPERLLRYVLAHPGVSVAIPGASYPDRIDANVAAAAEEPLTDSERRALEAEASLLYESPARE